ncbi:hypothetical protein HMN09_00760600 [Mycena chlorophos]|uniref:BSD domain-containing protein n=1 Tax=Mycena chlorophos TaxID=658473 RepID=A0A8H6SXB4_MYCCL|nr:hypothetical protein HMN09_00760600 [Mycena chlorophos]
MPSSVCAAKASYKKLPGLLELTDAHLQWAQDGKPPSIRVPLSDVQALFCSKENSAQVRLKVALFSEEGGPGHSFAFLSPNGVHERENFKNELTVIVGLNRAARDVAVQPPPSPPKPVQPVVAAAVPPPITSSIPPPIVPQQQTPMQTQQQPRLATPAQMPQPQPQRPTQSLSQTPSHSRAVSVASSSAATADPTRNLVIIPGNDYATDVRLRKEILKNNPELGALHRDLVVMSGQLSETEFWEGRQHLLLSLAAAENQKKGKPGQIVDPRPETVDGETKNSHDAADDPGDLRGVSGHCEGASGERTVQSMLCALSRMAENKEMLKHFFLQLTEEEFWTRYFRSKLYHAHRASIRSTAVQHVVQDDPILDKYLEKIDDELEPRRQRSERVEWFVDLGATSEDHVETGNEKDVTMLAGRQRGALPLIRKFNEHSERLLNSALGEIPASKRQKLNEEGDYGQIDLDDLHDAQSSAGIVLEMQDRQRYFEGGIANGRSSEADKPLDMKQLIRHAKANMDGWEASLAQLRIPKEAGDRALISMTQNVAARLDVKARKNDIPEALFRQMTICQAAANEFLRQFWSSMYPPAAEVQVAATPTPQQRAAKAAKMIGYLAKTHEKVGALVAMGPQHNVDKQRIEIVSSFRLAFHCAMKPVITAVNRAIAYHQSKTTKPAAGPRVS